MYFFVIFDNINRGFSKYIKIMYLKDDNGKNDSEDNDLKTSIIASLEDTQPSLLFQ